jgi:hypothetical protein
MIEVLVEKFVWESRREGREFRVEVRDLTIYKVSNFLSCRTNVLYTNPSKNNL